MLEQSEVTIRTDMATDGDGTSDLNMTVSITVQNIGETIEGNGADVTTLQEAIERTSCIMEQRANEKNEGEEDEKNKHMEASDIRLDRKPSPVPAVDTENGDGTGSTTQSALGYCLDDRGESPSMCAGLDLVQKMKTEDNTCVHADEAEEGEEEDGNTSVSLMEESDLDVDRESPSIPALPKANGDGVAATMKVVMDDYADDQRKNTSMCDGLSLVEDMKTGSICEETDELEREEEDENKSVGRDEDSNLDFDREPSPIPAADTVNGDSAAMKIMDYIDDSGTTPSVCAGLTTVGEIKTENNISVHAGDNVDRSKCDSVNKQSGNSTTENNEENTDMDDEEDVEDKKGEDNLRSNINKQNGIIDNKDIFDAVKADNANDNDQHNLNVDEESNINSDAERDVCKNEESFDTAGDQNNVKVLGFVNGCKNDDVAVLNTEFGLPEDENDAAIDKSVKDDSGRNVDCYISDEDSSSAKGYDNNETKNDDVVLNEGDSTNKNIDDSVEDDVDSDVNGNKEDDISDGAQGHERQPSGRVRGRLIRRTSPTNRSTVIDYGVPDENTGHMFDDEDLEFVLAVEPANFHEANPTPIMPIIVAQSPPPDVTTVAPFNPASQSRSSPLIVNQPQSGPIESASEQVSPTVANMTYAVTSPSDRETSRDENMEGSPVFLDSHEILSPPIDMSSVVNSQDTCLVDGDRTGFHGAGSQSEPGTVIACPGSLVTSSIVHENTENTPAPASHRCLFNNDRIPATIVSDASVPQIMLTNNDVSCSDYDPKEDLPPSTKEKTITPSENIHDDSEAFASAENDFHNIENIDESEPVIDQRQRTDQDADLLLDQVISGKTEKNMGPNSMGRVSGPMSCVTDFDDTDVEEPTFTNTQDNSSTQNTEELSPCKKRFSSSSAMMSGETFLTDVSTLGSTSTLTRSVEQNLALSVEKDITEKDFSSTYHDERHGVGDHWDSDEGGDSADASISSGQNKDGSPHDIQFPVNANENLNKDCSEIHSFLQPHSVITHENPHEQQVDIAKFVCGDNEIEAGGENEEKYAVCEVVSQGLNDFSCEEDDNDTIDDDIDNHFHLDDNKDDNDDSVGNECENINEGFGTNDFVCETQKYTVMQKDKIVVEEVSLSNHEDARAAPSDSCKEEKEKPQSPTAYDNRSVLNNDGDLDTANKLQDKFDGTVALSLSDAKCTSQDFKPENEQEIENDILMSIVPTEPTERPVSRTGLGFDNVCAFGAIKDQEEAINGIENTSLSQENLAEERPNDDEVISTCDDGMGEFDAPDELISDNNDSLKHESQYVSIQSRAQCANSTQENKAEDLECGQEQLSTTMSEEKLTESDHENETRILSNEDVTIKNPEEVDMYGSDQETKDPQKENISVSASKEDSEKIDSDNDVNLKLNSESATDFERTHPENEVQYLQNKPARSGNLPISGNMESPGNGGISREPSEESLGGSEKCESPLDIINENEHLPDVNESFTLLNEENSEAFPSEESLSKLNNECTEHDEAFVELNRETRELTGTAKKQENIDTFINDNAVNELDLGSNGTVTRLDDEYGEISQFHHLPQPDNKNAPKNEMSHENLEDSPSTGDLVNFDSQVEEMSPNDEILEKGNHFENDKIESLTEVKNENVDMFTNGDTLSMFDNANVAMSTVDENMSTPFDAQRGTTTVNAESLKHLIEVESIVCVNQTQQQANVLSKIAMSSCCTYSPDLGDVEKDEMYVPGDCREQTAPEDKVSKNSFKDSSLNHIDNDYANSNQGDEDVEGNCVDQSDEDDDNVRQDILQDQREQFSPCETGNEDRISDVNSELGTYVEEMPGEGNDYEEADREELVTHDKINDDVGETGEDTNFESDNHEDQKDDGGNDNEVSEKEDLFTPDNTNYDDGEVAKDTIIESYNHVEGTDDDENDNEEDEKGDLFTPDNTNCDGGEVGKDNIFEFDNDVKETDDDGNDNEVDEKEDLVTPDNTNYDGGETGKDTIIEFDNDVEETDDDRNDNEVDEKEDLVTLDNTNYDGGEAGKDTVIEFDNDVEETDDDRNENEVDEKVDLVTLDNTNYDGGEAGKDTVIEFDNDIEETDDDRNENEVDEKEDLVTLDKTNYDGGEACKDTVIEYDNDVEETDDDRNENEVDEKVDLVTTDKTNYDGAEAGKDTDIDKNLYGDFKPEESVAGQGCFENETGIEGGGLASLRDEISRIGHTKEEDLKENTDTHPAENERELVDMEAAGPIVDRVRKLIDDKMNVTNEDQEHELVERTSDTESGHGDLQNVLTQETPVEKITDTKGEDESLGTSLGFEMAQGTPECLDGTDNGADSICGDSLVKSQSSECLSKQVNIESKLECNATDNTICHVIDANRMEENTHLNNLSWKCDEEEIRNCESIQPKASLPFNNDTDCFPEADLIEEIPIESVKGEAEPAESLCHTRESNSELAMGDINRDPFMTDEISSTNTNVFVAEIHPPNATGGLDPECQETLSGSHQSGTQLRQTLSPASKVILETTDLWLNKISDFCKSPALELDEPSNDLQLQTFAAQCKSEILSISRCHELDLTAENDLNASRSYPPGASINMPRSTTERRRLKTISDIGTQQTILGDEFAPRPPGSPLTSRPQTSRSNASSESSVRSKLGTSDSHVVYTSCEGPDSPEEQASQPSLASVVSIDNKGNEPASETVGHAYSVASHRKSDIKQKSESNRELKAKASADETLDEISSFVSLARDSKTRTMSQHRGKANTGPSTQEQHEVIDQIRSKSEEEASKTSDKGLLRLSDRHRRGCNPTGTLPKILQQRDSHTRSQAFHPHPPCMTSSTQTDRKQHGRSRLGLRSRALGVGTVSPEAKGDGSPKTMNISPKSEKTFGSGNMSEKKSLSPARISLGGQKILRAIPTGESIPGVSQLSRQKMEPLKLPGQKKPPKPKINRMMTMAEFERAQADKHLCQAFARVNSSRPYVDCHMDTKIMEKTGGSVKRRRERVNYNSLIAVENFNFLEVLQYKRSSYDRDEQLKNFQKNFKSTVHLGK